MPDYNVSINAKDTFMHDRLIKGRAVALFVMIIALICVGCGGSQVPTKSEIAKAMSQHNMDNEMRARIVAGGEKLIPIIFEQMRLHSDPRDRFVFYNGWSLVRDMAMANTADSSAPFIRKVVKDKTWPVFVRYTAALMLYWFWDSLDVRKAILSQCESTAPKDPNQYDIWEISWYVAQAAKRSHKGIVDRRLVDRLLSIESTGDTTPLDIIGESSIPIIFNEFDAHYSRSKYQGALDVTLMLIIQRMIELNTSAPTAPELRAVLANNKYRPETRVAAAYALEQYLYSDEVQDASIECITNDLSDKVKAECVGVLWRMVSLSGKEKHWNIDKRAVNALSQAVRSKNIDVKKRAKDAVEDIQKEAKTHGVNLEWTTKLLDESSRQ